MCCLITSSYFPHKCKFEVALDCKVTLLFLIYMPDKKSLILKSKMTTFELRHKASVDIITMHLDGLKNRGKISNNNYKISNLKINVPSICIQ